MSSFFNGEMLLLSALFACGRAEGVIFFRFVKVDTFKKKKR